MREAERRQGCRRSNDVRELVDLTGIEPVTS